MAEAASAPGVPAGRGCGWRLPTSLAAAKFAASRPDLASGRDARPSGGMGRLNAAAGLETLDPSLLYVRGRFPGKPGSLVCPRSAAAGRLPPDPTGLQLEGQL